MSLSRCWQVCGESICKICFQTYKRKRLKGRKLEIVMHIDSDKLLHFLLSFNEEVVEYACMLQQVIKEDCIRTRLHLDSGSHLFHKAKDDLT